MFEYSAVQNFWAKQSGYTRRWEVDEDVEAVVVQWLQEQPRTFFMVEISSVECLPQYLLGLFLMASVLLAQNNL
jgi:hypothetical protein